ncbi:flagellar brake protein YcgR [Oxobacter pfennigii]|uniref:Flagellar brake protein YcgR n=1 Tax=Oxobacter pfennigii TaxID=36849 RepID=A0A0P8Y9S4_9CLOT|nr:flagellar brake domain-containing protein [Oxobacter pfennigii]KPU43654.1 flagellar brake protein YcgR [Oxobacter pfennigii]
MKIHNNLRSGQKIEIEVAENGERALYYSKIEEVIDDTTYIITAPVGRRTYSLLSVSDIVRVIYNLKFSIYTFEAEVMGRQKSNESILIKLKRVSEIYKIQRRNYYRLNAMVSVVIRFHPAGEENSEKIIKNFETVDISGGGIKLASNQLFIVNSNVSILINIPGIEREVIEGKVVRCEISEERHGLYQTGIQFTKIPKKVRYIIEQYILNKQREYLRKGIT